MELAADENDSHLMPLYNINSENFLVLSPRVTEGHNAIAISGWPSVGRNRAGRSRFLPGSDAL